MKDDSPFQHVLHHDDLSALPVGRFEAYPFFNVVARGMGKYIVADMPESGGTPHLHPIGSDTWADYRFRAVVTPISFENCPPTGGFCGIVARYKNESNYIALVLSRDGHVKLLRRTPSGFNLLATAPLVFCMGQSLSMTLIVVGGDITGIAGPYAGATVIKATLPAGEISGNGKAGFISSAQSRLGPHSVECTPAEATRIDAESAAVKNALEEKRTTFPKMKLDRTVPLNGPATLRDVRIADINGDGVLEILAGHYSAKIAADISLTRLTALTAYDLSGKILWQAGAIDPDSAASPEPFAGRLPFQIHDLYGDGHPVVVCVFGYDLQIRDGKSGRVMLSATTPHTLPVSDEFKTVATLVPGEKWGDETLNMNVAHIDFCDTQGSGGQREIAVRDAFHNLAVLDPMSEPILQPLFTHRGNLGGDLWAGDLDGDGKDELIAGFSILDDDGKRLASLTPGGEPHSVLVADPLNDDGAEKRVYFAAGSAGLLALNAQALQSLARTGSCTPSELRAAKLRADLPGLQFVAVENESTHQRVTLLDSSLNEIWTRTFDTSIGKMEAVNWTGKPEALLFRATAAGCALIDGHGDIVVESPANSANILSACVLKKYCPDGCDAIAAWNNRELSIYVPNP